MEYVGVVNHVPSPSYFLPARLSLGCVAGCLPAWLPAWLPGWLQTAVSELQVEGVLQRDPMAAMVPHEVRACVRSLGCDWHTA